MSSLNEQVLSKEMNKYIASEGARYRELYIDLLCLIWNCSRQEFYDDEHAGSEFFDGHNKTLSEIKNLKSCKDSANRYHDALLAAQTRFQELDIHLTFSDMLMDGDDFRENRTKTARENLLK